ncbi:MAG: hypothetical protein GQ564_08015, partial [Bacteroidales bacterium]|nr:hypothetical protein [Bacteroidales bacterium]
MRRNIMDTKCKTSSGAPNTKRWQIERLTGISQLKIIFIFIILFSVLGGQKIFAQGVGISETTIVPHISAILELSHTAGSFKGFLTPRMTEAERDLITVDAAANGLIIYNTTTAKLNIYDDATTSWLVLFSGTNGIDSIIGTTNRITIDNTNPAIPVIDIAGTYVGQTSITTLGTIGLGTWQASVVGTPYGGTGQSTYTDGQLLIGNSAGSLTRTTLTGTTNQINVTNGDGSITLSTPQDIDNAATPTFASLTLTNNLDVDGATTLDGTEIDTDDANFNVIGANQVNINNTLGLQVANATDLNSTLDVAGVTDL